MLLSGASGLRSLALSGPFPGFSEVLFPPGTPEGFWPVLPVTSLPGTGSLASWLHPPESEMTIAAVAAKVSLLRSVTPGL